MGEARTQGGGWTLSWWIPSRGCGPGKKACSLCSLLTKDGAHFHNANGPARMEADFWETGFQPQGDSCENSPSLRYVTGQCPPMAPETGPAFPETEFVLCAPRLQPSHPGGQTVFLTEHTGSQGKTSPLLNTPPLAQCAAPGHVSSATC